MAERYVTYIDFDRYAKSETTADTSLKHAALEAAFIAVDNALGRRVELASAVATARTFRSTGGCTLWLDDFTVLTSLVANGTTMVANTDFALEPLNGLSPAGEPRPYDRAVRASGRWVKDSGIPTVTVIARWGWPGTAIPPQIVEMCKIVGKAMLETRNFTQGVVALTDVGAFGARETKVVKDTIRDYSSHKTVVLF